MRTVSRLSSFNAATLQIALVEALDNDAALDVKIGRSGGHGRYVRLHHDKSSQDIKASIPSIFRRIKALEKHANTNEKRILNNCTRITGKLDIKLNEKLNGLNTTLPIT